MPYGIIGRKHSMSRIFQEDGVVVPITLVKCEDNLIKQIKTSEKDGYNSVVLAIEPLKKTTKTKKFRVIKEISIPQDQKDLKVGENVTVKDFKDVDTVEIVSIAKGKGFQGVIKRHKFHRGPMTHGSHHHRAPGSVGACVWPGRVMKGQKLPGRMGGQRVTLKSVPVVDIYPEENMIALKGPVPGSRNSLVEIIVKTVKS